MTNPKRTRKPYSLRDGVSICVHIETFQRDALDALAREQGTSVSYVLRQLLAQALAGREVSP